MSTSKIERTLDYVRIFGPGVDALDRRKEHNNRKQTSAEELRSNIDSVKTQLFEGIKKLRIGARERVSR
jgi:hypothetical protein